MIIQGRTRNRDQKTPSKTHTQWWRKNRSCQGHPKPASGALLFSGGPGLTPRMPSVVTRYSAVSGGRHGDLYTCAYRSLSRQYRMTRVLAAWPQLSPARVQGAVVRTVEDDCHCETLCGFCELKCAAYPRCRRVLVIAVAEWSRLAPPTAVAAAPASRPAAVHATVYVHSPSAGTSLDSRSSNTLVVTWFISTTWAGGGGKQQHKQRHKEEVASGPAQNIGRVPNVWSE